jgi:hypothetical protein
MEERRKADDAFMEKFFKLESAVQRLTEHEKLDGPKYERWHQETSERLAELEKMRLELSNGRLTTLENRPVIVQLTKDEIRGLFDEWGEILAGRLSFKFVLSVAGALGIILTAIITAAVIAYLKLK